MPKSDIEIEAARMYGGLDDATREARQLERVIAELHANGFRGGRFATAESLERYDITRRALKGRFPALTRS